MTTLDHPITSRTLTKVIHHFCNFYQPLPIREIARRLNEDPGNVHKMILRLEKAGLVEIKARYGKLLEELDAMQRELDLRDEIIDTMTAAKLLKDAPVSNLVVNQKSAATYIEQLLTDTVKSEVNKVLDEVLTYKVQWVDGAQMLHPMVRVSAIEQVRKEWNDGE